MKYLLPVYFLLVSFSCTSQTSPAPNEIQQTEDMIGIIEEMPRFPGCENQNLNSQKLKDCSQRKMLDYVYGNLEYPKITDENIKGTKAVVSFSVEIDGTLGNIKIARDPGLGIGQAAANVIHKMNNDGLVWIPGKQRGQIVVVQYNLPIQFEFE